ncbi:permease prefix domain 1-containing protein [Streptomyces zaomyceticus]|uniref:permease prefix domain 1-containing protein n=1 Tax=Streptomyces zaomyceticus TaxID=68286 RepID=UPI0036941117
MSADGREPDPVDVYVAELTAALHGPPGAKARLVEEIRGGLVDTVEARLDQGLSPDHAVREAVREFGTVAELLPGCQRELTFAQARHTARAVVLTAPFLIVCRHLAGTSGDDSAGLIPRTAQLLAVHAAGVAIVATLLAAAALAATGTLGRRLPTAHRLPLVVAWTGTTAGIAMAVTTLALATAAVLAANRPLLAGAGVLAAASHAAVAGAARACRRCVRPPVPGTPGLG